MGEKLTQGGPETHIAVTYHHTAQSTIQPASGLYDEIGLPLRDSHRTCTQFDWHRLGQALDCLALPSERRGVFHCVCQGPQRACAPPPSRMTAGVSSKISGACGDLSKGISADKLLAQLSAGWQ